MNFFRHILLVQVFFSTLNVYCSSCDLKSSLDNISACGYFESLMLVNAGTGFTVSEGTCGIEIDKTVYVDQPYVFFPNANEDKQYTLVMVDNDDPYTEDGKDFLQWLVINIDGTSLKHGVGAFYGEAAAAYLAPDPAQESCVHRYSIYLYEQIFHPLTFPDLPPLRSDFNIRDFVENVVPRGAFCGPVASIEFRSRY